MSDSNLILEVKGLNKWFGVTYANAVWPEKMAPASPPCSPRLPAFSPATPAKCF